MKAQIRRAERNDMPEVLELIRELAVFEREPDAVEITVEDLQHEGFGENPLFTCFVAEMQDEIVGAALIYYRFSTWKGRTLHLEDLIVKEEMRGKGIGEALYSEVIKFAAEQKLKRIAWDVLDWNEGAIKFYERSGAKILKDWRVVHLDEMGIKNYKRPKSEDRRQK